MDRSLEIKACNILKRKSKMAQICNYSWDTNTIIYPAVSFNDNFYWGAEWGRKAIIAPSLPNFTLLPFLFCTNGCKYSFHTQILTHTHPSYKHLKSEATTRTRGHICIFCQVKKNPFSEVSWYLPEVAFRHNFLWFCTAGTTQMQLI